MQILLLLLLSSVGAYGFLNSASSRCPTIRVSMTSVKRNENFEKLKAGYLFPEIGRRRTAYLAANPNAKLISLGIGDTTMPVPPHILKGLVEGSSRLGTKAGYTGYGAEQGVKALREKIASKLYNNLVQVLSI